MGQLLLLLQDDLLLLLPDGLRLLQVGLQLVDQFVLLFLLLLQTADQ